ncbi:peptidase S24, partial [Xylella fastidiosa subsp. multiplex]|nr:peptidase S24 [Xylella fastidiosa subsp. multiplex]
EHPSTQGPERTKLDTYELRIIDGDEDLDREADVLIDEVDVFLAAGSAVVIPEFIETTFRMPFPLSWLRDVHISSKDVKLM